MTAEPAYITVGVVTHNSEPILAACLLSVRAALESNAWPGPVRLCVIDNASADGSIAIAEEFADSVLKSERNLGFAAACNKIASAFPSEWYVFVNPDAFIPPHGWDDLARVLQGAPSRAIVVPRLLNPDGSRQHNFFLSPTPLALAAMALGGTSLADPVQWLRRKLGAKPTHVSGALFICSGALWHELSGFDERYFLYAEETDFCIRAREASAAFIDSPETVAVHAGSQGLESKTPTTYVLLVQSQLKLLERFHGRSAARLYFLALWVGLRLRRLKARFVGWPNPRVPEMYDALSRRSLGVLLGAGLLELHAPASPSFLVYDPDGVNPYGRELAALVALSNERVLLLLARDAEWVPGPSVTTRRVLPGNRGGRHKLSQVISLLNGLLLTLAHSFRGSVIVLAWTRSTVEDIVFALLAIMGRPVLLVSHNPGPGRQLAGIRGRAQRWLGHRASAVVAHSYDLADLAARDFNRSDVSVCSFPPYWEWRAQWAATGHHERNGGPVRLLLLGQLRPDKGVASVPEIMAKVPADLREALEVVLCGRGTLHSDVASALARTVNILDLTSESFVNDECVAEVVGSSDLLLAPYSGATQSSSVAVALAAGLPVLAFDDGSIRDIVDDRGLVPAGDVEAFADLLVRFLRGGLAGGPRGDFDRWRSQAGDDWMGAVRCAATSRSKLNAR